MGEILTFILTNAAVRTFIEGLAIKIVADILHRRSIDPQFLTSSDTVFAQISNAKTDEDRINAHKALQALMASSGAP